MDALLGTYSVLGTWHLGIWYSVLGLLICNRDDIGLPTGRGVAHLGLGWFWIMEFGLRLGLGNSKSCVFSMLLYREGVMQIKRLTSNPWSDLNLEIE